VTRSDVRRLEEQGVGSRAIRRVVNQHGNAGERALKRVERKHASGASGSSRSSSSSGSANSVSKVRTVSGTRVAYDSDRNRVVNARPFEQRKQGVPLTKDSRKEVNQLLRQGYSFEAPDSGRYNTRNVAITQRGIANGRPRSGELKGRGRTGEQTTSSLTLYQTLGQRRGDRDRNEERSGTRRTSTSSSTSGRSSSSSSSRSSSSAPATDTAGQAPWSGSTEPPKPTMYGPNPTPPAPPGITPPGSVYWDSTPENLFNFSDRIGAYNRDMNQWMRNEADTDRRNQSTMLNQFASVLPRVESPDEANNRTLSFLERAQKVLKLV
jgi:hypothetical protein